MSTVDTATLGAPGTLELRAGEKHEGSHGPAKAGAGADNPKLDPASGKKWIGIAGGVAAVGLGLSAAAFAADRERFAFSWLVGFTFTATVGLGGLFFVLIHHLTRAGWSVAARRQAEWLSSILLAVPVLFLPVYALKDTLYAAWLGPNAAHDEVVHEKAAYLNAGAFTVRAAVYFAAWILLAWWFSKESEKQDVDGDPGHTLKMQARSAPAMPLFGLTLTFAAFDWLMSLDPHWYSTIFGVYVFSGAVVSGLAALALLTVGLQTSGYFRKVSTVEHRHDVGKLLFGFTVFWAYIAFSQFFLIWYANIPEETLFFRERMTHEWMPISALLLFGHFVVPFGWLMSRHTKRSAKGLCLGAVILLAMHWIDMYWLVMPNLDHHAPHFSWIDLAGLLGPAGVGALVVARKAASTNLFPTQDPRLSETYKVENL